MCSPQFGTLPHDATRCWSGCCLRSRQCSDEACRARVFDAAGRRRPPIVRGRR
jgi:hypothetical protein